MGMGILATIVGTHRCFVTYKRKNLEDVGLHPALHAFVNYICHHPGCRQEDVIRVLCVDKTTAAHHLNKLEEQGYIERRQNPEDLRRRVIYPTQKAQDAHPRIHEVYGEFQEQILEGLTEEEKEQLQGLMQKVYQNARYIFEQGCCGEATK